MDPTITNLYRDYLAVTDNPQAAATLVLAHVSTQSQTEMLTAREAAKELGVSPSMVYSLCRDGQLRHRKIGRSVRIQPQDLRDYMDAANKQPRGHHFSCLTL